MFIKTGDDPKTKIVVVDPSGVEELDVNTKVALDKIKETIVKTIEDDVVQKEKN